jgi:predicted DCC family thiol-disulfide oxidoreductase YuxK
VNRAAHDVRGLTVLFDASCPLCVRCARWLAHEPAYVPLTTLAASSTEARERYGAVPWLGEELVVVADDGAVWVGPAAFLVALWSLVAYREWSYRLSGDTLSRVAERFFVSLSSQRRMIAAFLEHDGCADGACHLGAEGHPYR